MIKKIAGPIRFEFKIDKFIACMAMFAKAGLSEFDKLKAAKLLYFADKQHVIRYGTPIIGDSYVHLDYGPVPSKALDIINDVLEDRSVKYVDGISNKEKFNEYLSVKKLLRKYPVFVLKKEPCFDALSASEQEAITDTCREYGHFSPGALIDEAHKDSSWLKTSKNQEIDYRLFFDNEPKAVPGALEYLETLSGDYLVALGIGFNG